MLVRVAVRPAYRLFGGNERPLLATVATFVYTALVVHLLGPTAAVLLALRLAAQSEPDFRLGAIAGSNLNFSILFGAVAAYALFGTLAGLSKVLRRRRRRLRTGRTEPPPEKQDPPR